MSFIQKKIDFDSFDESGRDESKCGIIRNIEEIRHDIGDFHEDDDSMGLTSSPLSRKLLLQSPRKVKRHMRVAFQTWTETESGEFSATASEHDDDPPTSPLTSRFLSEMAGGDLNANEKPVNPLTFSPPYKRVRALRLFDTPITPKTIYEKSNGHYGSSLMEPRFRAGLYRETPPRPAATAFPRKLDKPVANINPFSPDEQLRMRKRTRSLRSLPT